MIDQSDVTIIIPYIQLSKETDFAHKECLKSLNETAPEMKKIVAINAMKTEDPFQTVRYPNMSFIVLEEQGQELAVNAAVATTNTKWVFVTNNDMIYPPGWWEKLMVGHSFDMACVSPKLIEPRPGAPTFEVFFAGGAGGDFDKQKWEKFADEYMKADVHRPVRTGFNLPFLMRRDVFDLVGGYDIEYSPWGASGDTDLQCKVELAGIKTYQNPNCIVYHFSQTSNTFLPENHGYWQKNYAYFEKKWGFERPGGDDVWNSRNLIKYEQIKFKPWWENFYKKALSENKAKLS